MSFAPSTSLAIARVDPLREICNPIRRAIAPRYIRKAKIAFENGLYDSAINYFWDLTVNDLRSKIEAFGADIFRSVEDDVKFHESGPTLSDRWCDISDGRLLSGCLKLNLISRTAFRHLSHCLSVRNHESAAHPVDEEEEVDRETSIAFIYDCVRFVLSRDLPEPGVDFKGLIENLKKRDLAADAEEIRELLRKLLPGQIDTVLGMMVSVYVGGDETAKKNVPLFIREVWTRSSDAAREKIGLRYSKFVSDIDRDSKTELFGLLTFVDGISVIPASLRLQMFRRASQNLIDAHFSFDNFLGEIIPARQLSELGVDCPNEGLEIFATAFLVSYLGNYYGESRGAQRYLEALKERFELRHKTAVLEAIRKSDKVHSEMGFERPYRRLRSLCREILPFLVTARDKEDCEFILGKSSHQALDRFAPSDE
ncbi:MAG: hypothetical protein ABSH08_15175 [Tepidisphaeraceae bacterium]|jgi:hypothetical protein